MSVYSSHSLLPLIADANRPEPPTGSPGTARMADMFRPQRRQRETITFMSNTMLKGTYSYRIQTVGSPHYLASKSAEMMVMMR